MQIDSLNYNVSKLSIGKTIIDAINHSPLSDVELGERVGVSRNTIRLWRTGKTPFIRKINLQSLATALQKSVDYSADGIVEFTDLKQITKNHKFKEIGEMSQVLTERLIDTLTTQINQKDNRIQELEKEINLVNEEKHELHQLLKNNHSQDFTIEEDYETYQVIVTANDNKIINCTKLYAQLYGKSVDEIKTTPVHELIHEDDMWRLQVSQKHKAIEEERANIPSTWKIPCCNEDFYMSATLIYLEKEGVYKLRSKISTKKEYEKTTEYYNKLAESGNVKGDT